MQLQNEGKRIGYFRFAPPKAGKSSRTGNDLLPKTTF